MVFVLKDVTFMSLCLFNDHLILRCVWLCFLNVLMDLIVDCGMVQQVNHMLLFCILVPLTIPDGLFDAEIQISCCLSVFLSEVSEIGVSEMPKGCRLFEAFLECLPYLLNLLGVLYHVFKSVPAVVCFFTSCHKYKGILSLLWYLVCHEDHFHVTLELPPSSNFLCHSPIHLQILLSQDSLHSVLKDGPFRTRPEI